LTVVKGTGPWAAWLFQLAEAARGRHRSGGCGGCLYHRLGRAAG